MLLPLYRHTSPLLPCHNHLRRFGAHSAARPTSITHLAMNALDYRPTLANSRHEAPVFYRLDALCRAGVLPIVALALHSTHRAPAPVPPVKHVTHLPALGACATIPIVPTLAILRVYHNEPLSHSAHTVVAHTLPACYDSASGSIAQWRFVRYGTFIYARRLTASTTASQGYDISRSGRLQVTLPSSLRSTRT